MQKKSNNFLKKQYEKFKDIKMVEGYIFFDLNKPKEETEEEGEFYPN